jgi:CheY-like chemotaxis protein
VDVAENGYSAYEMVKSKPRTFYEVIILDINMPIMNGIEAYDKITMYLEEKNITATLSKICGGSINMKLSSLALS